MRRPGDQDKQVVLEAIKNETLADKKDPWRDLKWKWNYIGVNYNELGKKFSEANCASTGQLKQRHGCVVYLIVK